MADLILSPSQYAPEHIEYGVNRYQNETRRLYGVLDKHLHDTQEDYLVGNKCTVSPLLTSSGWPARLTTSRLRTSLIGVGYQPLVGLVSRYRTFPL